MSITEMSAKFKYLHLIKWLAMVFVGQETHFGKICSHSIIFVTPLLFMKKLYVISRFFMTPPLYSKKYEQPR